MYDDDDGGFKLRRCLWDTDPYSRWTQASQVDGEGAGAGAGAGAPTAVPECGILTTAHNLQSQIRSKSHGVAHSEDKCDGHTTSLRTDAEWDEL